MYKWEYLFLNLLLHFVHTAGQPCRVSKIDVSLGSLSKTLMQNDGVSVRVI